ncbi:MAG: hypothetical protein ABIQ06_00320 [Caldimonas sp.]
MAHSTFKPVRYAFAAAFVMVAAGCSTSPQLAAQWTDPQLGAQSGFLRGSRVLVACDVADLTVRQLCQDRVAGELAARGATPVFPGPDTAIATDRSIDGQLLAAARSANAKAVMVLTLTPAVTDVSPGFSVGIGGFGFGRSSAVGVGVAAPIGGGRVIIGYAANGRVTDVGTGRLVWSASASTAPSSEIDNQLGELSKTVFGAADKSGLF